MLHEIADLRAPAFGQAWREVTSGRTFVIYNIDDDRGAIIGTYVETPGQIFRFEPAEFIGQFEFLADQLNVTEAKGPSLPADNLRDGLPFLRAPFTKEAVRFKVQTVFKEAKGCIVVGYIDARLVYERLNYVMGALWQDDYEPLPNDLMLCRLTVDGVTRQNVGSGYKGKGLYSDALKRTAVAFGVGVSVYALPQITLFNEAVDKGHLERFTTPKGPSLRITDKGHAALRSGYEKWLNETGIPQFGQPIDHGDVEDSAGEEPEAVAASAEVNDLPAVSMPLTDEKADAARTMARQLLKEIHALPKGKSRKPLAAFNSELAAASKSHDDLAAFLKSLEEIKAELS